MSFNWYLSTGALVAVFDKPNRDVDAATMVIT